MKGLLCTTDVVSNILADRQKQDRRPIGLSVNLHPNATVRISDKGVLQVRCLPENEIWVDIFWGNDSGPKRRHCKPIKHPHQAGDVLYVRENIRVICYGRGDLFEYGEYCIEYLADKQLVACPIGYEKWWRHNWHVRPAATIPNIHMPKWAARIFLEVTGVRCERVQDISIEDAVAEGVSLDEHDNTCMGDCANRSCDYEKGEHLCDIYHTNEDCPETEAFGMLWNSLYPGTWDKNIFVWVTEFKQITKEHAERK